MSEAQTAYGVAYIAEPPQAFKVGDRVEVVDEDNRSFGKHGVVSEINSNGIITVCFDMKNLASYFSFVAASLRKLPDTICVDEGSDNVKAFKAILNEMAETYKAKDADYGSAYDDGYRLFGHTQLLSRIYEKFSRVKHLLDGNKQNVAESVYDTLTDLSVQAICLRMLLQKNDFENVD